MPAYILERLLLHLQKNVHSLPGHSYHGQWKQQLFSKSGEDGGKSAFSKEVHRILTRSQEKTKF
jgi:hypothetical protein